ncbi:30S ribosomal protein S18 [Patescibacteria group bacterium]|nr:30S ribosomal protein S18 [Patescibacteria group bacterium]
MAKKSKFKRKRQIIEVPDKCSVCESGKEPDYKDYRFLRGYLTERAKMIGKVRSGVCSKHQRGLSRAIKRARHLGLLPFAPTY